MEALFTHGMPRGVVELITSPPGTSLRDLAGRAQAALTEMTDDSARSRAGQCLLVFLQGRTEGHQRQTVVRALQVMARFPHYPRPRAEVARRALECLASS